MGTEQITTQEVFEPTIEDMIQTENGIPEAALLRQQRQREAARLRQRQRQFPSPKRHPVSGMPPI